MWAALFSSFHMLVNLLPVKGKYSEIGDFREYDKRKLQFKKKR